MLCALPMDEAKAAEIVATLRREAKFLDEFLAALYGSASA